MLEITIPYKPFLLYTQKLVKHFVAILFSWLTSRT